MLVCAIFMFIQTLFSVFVKYQGVVGSYFQVKRGCHTQGNNVKNKIGMHHLTEVKREKRL